MINFASVLLWGLVATVVLSTLMAGAQGLGLSRMSLPLMLGTALTADHTRALLAGFALHFASGWVFALFYAFLFEDWGRASWWLGTATGLAHGLAVLTLLMPVLPAVHPRMASESRGPEPTKALEPPGFLALNYGRQTPVVTLLAHMTYGGILGACYRLAGS
jgi:hypothetical protein